MLKYALFALVSVLGLHTSSGAQSLETLVHFECRTFGCAPNAQLLQAANGDFYGTTSEADAPWSGDGTVFRMDRYGSIEVLLSPARFFFEAADGFFYGTTPSGGAFDAGTVYRMDEAGIVTDLYSFDGISAGNPGALVQTHDGRFYGIATIPLTDEARPFRMNQDGTVTLLRPMGSAIRNVRMLLASSRSRFLYGTTYGGVVFRLNRNGQAHVLHTFPSVYVDVMEASDGFFYGTTIDGGANGVGLVFRMSRAGKVQVLHSFAGGNDGAAPYEAPIEGADGYLYGTTGAGGTYDLGTVYRLDRNGVVTILHSFGGSADAGANPVGELVLGDDGALYGTTVRGGIWDHGTAFRLFPPSQAGARRREDPDRTTGVVRGREALPSGFDTR